MSQIYKQGHNWVIIDHIGNIDLPKQVLTSVTKDDWSMYTSAKGPNSRQHYLINPSWMLMQGHQEPAGWTELRDKWKKIVQREVVDYGLMPANWSELHACSAWTVVGEEGSYHTAHDHGPNNICSITYLNVPKKSVDSDSPEGQIFFILDGSSYNPLSVPNFRILHVQPQEGMIIIFPSWIIHGVYPQGPGIRQTMNIDFNGDPNYKFNVPSSGGASYN